MTTRSPFERRGNPLSEAERERILRKVPRLLPRDCEFILISVRIDEERHEVNLDLVTTLPGALSVDHVLGQLSAIVGPAAEKERRALDEIDDDVPFQ